MKKKEIDLFNILLGLVIGCLIGFFIFTQVKTNENDTIAPTNKEEVYGTVYIIQLGASAKVEDLNIIIERLNVLGLYYELYEEGGKNYVFNSIYSSLSEAQEKKKIIESYGFAVTIRSEYILDLPKIVIAENEKYEFYNEVVNNLLYSLKNETVIISEKYYNNPIDIELFSNMTILMTIKNDSIKENYQLNTFCLLLKKIK